MPELPEVETLARDLRRLLRGAAFSAVEVLWPGSVARPSAEELARLLPGHTIEDVTRRGKFLVLSLSGPSYLLIHLRMSGQLLVESPAAPLDRHVRLVLHLTDGRRLLFSDQRKFGRVYWTANPGVVLGQLGPDLLDRTFTAEAFRALLSRCRGAIKPLLLDQRRMAGLGNIYTDEALFAARIHPLRPANSLSEDEAGRLYQAIRVVLETAIDNRGTTLDDERYHDAEGQPGRHALSLQVYQQAGQPCPCCGRPIQRIVVAGRGTHICPVCQDSAEGGSGAAAGQQAGAGGAT